MNQYEERLRRVNEYMDTSNTGYMQAQDELEAYKTKQEAEQKERDEFLQMLIEKSSALKKKVGKLVTAKGNTNDRLREAMNEIEMSVAQMYDLKSDSDNVAIELRDHFMDLYQRTVVGLLKKHQASE